MKFRSAFSGSLRFFNPHGRRIRKTYCRSSSGELIESGVEDVYDSIQKAANGITVEDLIRRAERGDTTAIPVPVDSYGDMTHIPKDLLEAHTMLSSLRDRYNELPAELRAKFGNDFTSFVSASADGSAIAALSQLNKSNLSMNHEGGSRDET